MTTVVKNLSRPTVSVLHSGLDRAGDSAYKSKCPVCPDGVLVVSRDGTMRIVRTDICRACGQTFRYLDKVIAGEIVWDDMTARSVC